MTERNDWSAVPATGFDDLLRANARFAERFTLGGFDGVAHRGVAVVTCMDSRIDPLGMLGLVAGDAKILRDLGGRVTDEVLAGLSDQAAALREDVVRVRSHPLISDVVLVGGFMYDVDTGLLHQVA